MCSCHMQGRPCQKLLQRMNACCHLPRVLPDGLAGVSQSWPYAPGPGLLLLCLPAPAGLPGMEKAGPPGLGVSTSNTQSALQVNVLAPI
jgi:hypothetical protein